MAKKSAGVAAMASGSKPNTEIDDIFNLKAKAPAPNPVQLEKVLPKSKKNNKNKALASLQATPGIKLPVGESVTVAKKRKIETVIDESSLMDAYRPEAVPTMKATSGALLGKRGPGGERQADEEEKFMDSRGTARELCARLMRVLIAMADNKLIYYCRREED